VTCAAAQDTLAAADSLFALGEWQKAAREYAMVVEKAPENGRAWFRLGAAYMQLEKYDAAITPLTRANELGFARRFARYNLASAQARLGNPDAAFEWLHAAVEAGFSNLGMLQSDSDLDALRDDARFAQVVQEAKAQHPCARPECRQFDFWAGAWKVFDPAGRQVGRNSIVKIENACALRESWTSSSGGTGTSINYYHPGRGKWVQTWVSGSGAVIEIEGEYRDGAMHFTGTNFQPDGSSEICRATWTLLDDGRVRQFWEQSRDDGKSWYVWFDGYYVRE
jgi:hypothetical protein